MTTRSSMLVPRMKNAWRRSGVDFRPGVAAADIKSFEHSRGVRLGDDIAEYFRFVDGMDEGNADEHGIRFWPLAEMRPVLEELPSDRKDLFGNYFVFADYSLWAHGYAVRVTDSTDDDVIIVGSEMPIVVAQNFGDFLEFYVNRPEKLFP